MSLYVGNYYFNTDVASTPKSEFFKRLKGRLETVCAPSARLDLVGVDVVEVNPYLDHAELTQHISVQLLLETIASGFRNTTTIPAA